MNGIFIQVFILIFKNIKKQIHYKTISTYQQDYGNVH